MSAHLLPLASAHLKGPHVDFGGLSPLIALLGGATIVLLVGLLARAGCARSVVPALSLVALAAAAGLTIWQWNAHKSIVSGALRIDDLSLVLNLILIDRRGAQRAAGVALAGRARSRSRRVPRAAADIGRGHVAARGGAEHGRSVRRPGAALDTAVRVVRRPSCGASTRSSRG